MHRLTLAALACLCLTASAFPAGAQSSAAARAPADAIEAAERSWASALVSKDMSELEANLDARFRLVNVGLSGSVDHDAYLAQQSEPIRAYRQMTPSNIRVAVNGRIAVATIDMTVGWPAAIDAPRNWRFTDTWIWQEGRWRVVSRVSQQVNAG